MTTGDIAAALSLEIRGRADGELTHVASLAKAGPGALSFVSSPRFVSQLAHTRAAAVILHPDHADDCPVTALLSRDPYLDYARAAQLIFPRPSAVPGIAASAVVDDSATIADSACIGPQAVIGVRANIGERVFIGAGAVIGDEVVIGEDTRIAPRAVIHHGVRIGQRCDIASGAVIGGDGFGYANDSGQWVKIPQIGSVRIGDDVDIGANTTIDRGAIEDTVIGNGVKLDNLIQIAHNVRIGDHTAMAGCAGVAGSTTIGKYCSIGGSANIYGHLTIADHTTITGQTFVTRSIETPGVYSSGVPMQENRVWRRNYVRFKQLDELAARLKALEKKLG